jgi:hypothetical protein
MPLLYYHPPKSVSHGHSPRVQNPRQAWDATQAFLRDHTVSELRPQLRLTVLGVTKFTDPAVVESILQQALDAFGPSTSVWGIFHNWDLPGDRLSDALEFALSDEHRPRQEVDSVSLHLSYAFSWKDLPNPSPDEARKVARKGRNSLGLSVGGHRLFMQPTFLFEVPEQTSSFITRLQAIEAATPFVPRDDYYYLTESRQSKDGIKLTRLKSGWKNQ